ncbi:MAG: hypothetical protein K8R92_01925 [Planctomycetes bacterium]|nr:hypothetical protein [Planctomycetota bacterium]
MKSLKPLMIATGAIALTSAASAALVSGDIAIVQFQVSGVGSDSISFATLVDLSPGTVLYFSDNGYTNPTGFRGVTAADNDGNENLMKFTVGAGGLLAGNVVSSKSAAYASNWTLSGTIYTTGSGAYQQLSLSSTGEQVTVFTSTNVQPMLSGFSSLYNFDNTGAYEAATTSSTGELAPGLVQGTSAFLTSTQSALSKFNFAAFSGAADRATWLARFGNTANWTFSASTADTTDGTFLIPTPGAAALLGLAGLAARRRR